MTWGARVQTCVQKCIQRSMQGRYIQDDSEKHSISLRTCSIEAIKRTYVSMGLLRTTLISSTAL
jgi:hypothetical protein